MMRLPRSFSEYESLLEGLEERYRERHNHSFDLSAIALNTAVVLVQPAYTEMTSLIDGIIRMGINPDNIFMVASPLASDVVAQLTLQRLLPNYIAFEWPEGHTSNEASFDYLEQTTCRKLFERLVKNLDKPEYENVDTLLLMDGAGYFMSLLNQQLSSWDRADRYYNVISAKEIGVDLLTDPNLPCYRQQILTAESAISQWMLEERYIKIISRYWYDINVNPEKKGQLGIIGSGTRLHALIRALNYYSGKERPILLFDPSGESSQQKIAELRWSHVYIVDSMEALLCQSVHVFVTEDEDVFFDCSLSSLAGRHSMTTLYNVSCSTSALQSLVAARPIDPEALHQDLVVSSWSPSNYMFGFIPTEWKKITLKKNGLPLLPQSGPEEFYGEMFRLVDHARIYSSLMQALSTLQCYLLAKQHQHVELMGELQADQMFDPSLQADLMYKGTLIYEGAGRRIMHQSAGQVPLLYSEFQERLVANSNNQKGKQRSAGLSSTRMQEQSSSFIYRSFVFSRTPEGLVVDLPRRLSADQQESIRSLLFWLLSYGAFSFKYWVLDQSTNNEHGVIYLSTSSLRQVSSFCELFLRSIIQKLHGNSERQQQRAIDLVSQWPHQVVYIYSCFFNDPGLIPGVFRCLASENISLREAALTAMSHWDGMLLKDIVQIGDTVEALVTSNKIQDKENGLSAIQAMGTEIILIKSSLVEIIIADIASADSQLHSLSINCASQLDWNRILSHPRTLRSIAYRCQSSTELQNFFRKMSIDPQLMQQLLPKKSKRDSVAARSQDASLTCSREVMYTATSAMTTQRTTGMISNVKS